MTPRPVPPAKWHRPRFSNDERTTMTEEQAARLINTLRLMLYVLAAQAGAVIGGVWFK